MLGSIALKSEIDVDHDVQLLLATRIRFQSWV